MTDEGVLTTIEATSADGVLTLILFRGTMVLDCLGNPLYWITVKAVTSPEPPSDTRVIRQAYQFEPCCTFDPPVEVRIRYDGEAVPDGVNEQHLAIGRYSNDEREWVLLPSVVDTGAQTVIASVGHTSFLAMQSPVPGVAPTSTPEGDTIPDPEAAATSTPDGAPTSTSGLATGVWIGIGIGVLLLFGPIVWLLTRRR